MVLFFQDVSPQRAMPAGVTHPEDKCSNSFFCCHEHVYIVYS
jgi:hypothetical protein